MRLKRSDLLGCVEVEGTQVEVVGAAHEPILSCDKLDAAYGDFGHFKGLDEGASLVVPDKDVAVVEASQKPWLGRVKVYGFDAFRPIMASA